MTGGPRQLNPRRSQMVPADLSCGLSPEEQASAFRLTANAIHMLTVAASPLGCVIGPNSPTIARLLENDFLKAGEALSPHRTVARITELGFRAVLFWGRHTLITVGASRAP